jgi:hypothetical protein
MQAEQAAHEQAQQQEAAKAQAEQLCAWTQITPIVL